MPFRTFTVAVVLILAGLVPRTSYAAAPTDLGPLSLFPFGTTIYRYGDQLVNRALSDVFGNGSAARSTRVTIYNHSPASLYLIFYSFQSGGFSPGSQPTVLYGKSVHSYSVESHGVATGVTGADLRFGLAPGAPSYCVRVLTTNPFFGSNDAWGEGHCNLKVPAKPVFTVGNNNEVYIDIW